MFTSMDEEKPSLNSGSKRASPHPSK